MTIKISSAPCCWGVDNPKNPHLPPWTRVLSEAGQAGYRGIELGPYGYLPLDAATVAKELNKNDLKVVAGTIFDDLVAPQNLDNLLEQTHNICALLNQLPAIESLSANKRFPAPYLVIIDWGHPERDSAAGQSSKAPRLTQEQWQTMMGHIQQIAELAWQQYGIRSVVHPHAGGYIEFEDEIRQLVDDLSYEQVGLCLDTGHLYYSGMNPESWLREFAHRIDYVHFKDVDQSKFESALARDLPFFEAVAEGVMCPIGTGVLDYPAIRQALLDIGYEGYITIEQERDPRDSDTSLRDVKASRDYLTRVGFA